MPTSTTPSAVVAAQIRERRRQLNLNRQELAERCVEGGVPRLTLAALTNIETGRPDDSGKRRRDVTVDELLVLAHALDIHPVGLLVSPTAADDEPYPLAPKVTTTAAVARAWISGMGFLSEPESLVDLARAVVSMPRERAQEVTKRWFTPERHPEGLTVPQPLTPGDVIHGFAYGAFGRDHYHCVRIEAVGPDWIVARDPDNPDYGPSFTYGRRDLELCIQARDEPCPSPWGETETCPIAEDPHPPLTTA